MIENGESPTVIARILGVCRTSLYRGKKMAQADPKGLAARPHLAPKVRLADEQLAELETLLLQGATKHGWPNVLWTAQRVAEMIHRHWGITDHVEHVRTILRHRLRWSSQKPQKKVKQRNHEKIDHGRRQDLPEILQKAEDRQAHVVFLDESGFPMTPVVGRTDAPRGKTPIVEAFFGKGKISAISAVTVSPVRKRCGLSFQRRPDNTNAHGEETVALLARLRRRLQGPMTILWDQSQIHQRSRVVKKSLARPPEVVTEEFPG